MRPGQEAKSKEVKTPACTEKVLTHNIEKGLTYQEWVNSLLTDSTSKTFYEKEVAKAKK